MLRSFQILDGDQPRRSPDGTSAYWRGAQLAHVAVILDDHVAGHGMLREPGCDFIFPVGAGRARRGLVDNAASEPLRLQHLLQLGDGLAGPPGGRDDDISSGTRHDLVQHPDARGLKVSVPIPPADRGQHAVDVEKNHPSRHFF